MKAVILAAGYQTRLEKDLAALSEEDAPYQILNGRPKALLPLKGGVLLDHLLAQIKNSGIEEIYIVTNGKYYPQFCSWAQGRNFALDHIINDGTLTNEQRKGALVDLELVVRSLPDDLLVVAGDIVFYPHFELKQMVQDYHDNPRPLIAMYQEYGDTSRRGIVEVCNGRVESFIEKPASGTTTSRLASTACYVLPLFAAARLQEYLSQTQTLAERDAPGHFIAWLHTQMPVYAFEIPGRFDFGSLDDYQKMESELSKSELLKIPL